jgi:DNA-binding Lrp family transcriptional regulator
MVGSQCWFFKGKNPKSEDRQMATRSNLSTKILESMEAWGSSEHDPASISEIAGELEVEGMEVFNALNKLEDAGKVTGIGRGLDSKWFLGKAEEAQEQTPTPAQRVKRRRRTKAEMAEAEAEAKNRTAYSANVAESQDGDMQHATPRVISAETPVIAENGETVTVPVDWDDDSKGRRELDSDKGERIISEDDMTELLKRVRERLRNEKPLTTDQWAEVVTQTVFDDFQVTRHEPKNGPALEVEIPPLPAGVHPHTWELAHQGNTEGARNFHLRQAKKQEEEYAARS